MTSECEADRGGCLDLYRLGGRAVPIQCQALVFAKIKEGNRRVDLTDIDKVLGATNNKGWSRHGGVLPGKGVRRPGCRLGVVGIWLVGGLAGTSIVW
jgi:hypothetical protein